MNKIKYKILKLIKKIGIKNKIDIIIYNNNKILIKIELNHINDKKKIESKIKKCIYKNIYKNIKIKIISNIKEKKYINNIKNIIVIASGKGGVGKSTIAANIALTISNLGFKVGLLDADLYGPSIPLMFDIENEKISIIEIENCKKILPIIKYGIKILSIGFFSELNQAIVWRGPMASKAIKEFINESFWDKLDFLIVDLPPGTGDITLSLIQELNITGVILVSTPQIISLIDVRKSIAMFNLKQINVPIIGIIENMSFFSPKESPNKKYYIFGEEGVKKMAKYLNIKFLGEIPIIESIRKSADFGCPIVLKNEKKIYYIFLKIAKKIINFTYINNI
ncbi:Mrp/NBP35 family ATP-binding protein [Candidatus Karelsulcia muelleri]|uniref:Iron-sulfur cluster carrier protein n=1 Tax=Candidatus Karelsulcia muelleri PSPU TaxID=1189303 RepID=A0AAD1EXC4_9FLAO|nr:Mrp/NBP35 family ATP-binding protein [Candidatus Karelsulcia muelleri]BAO66328.1 Mrp/Nbp35 family ATP-binding protein [Candidatus Karelsulcia muelleri PSPU]